MRRREFEAESRGPPKRVGATLDVRVVVADEPCGAGRGGETSSCIPARRLPADCPWQTSLPDERSLAWHRLQCPLDTLGIARDDGEVGFSWLVRLRAALFPIS